MIEILIPAFLLSVILLGIHAYFGLEIIKRGIIFTDLAIGQMAAVGAAISLILFNGKYSYVISLFFALSAAVLIAYISRKSKNVEAFIGLMYALGVSSIFIIMSNSPHGMEEFNKLMAADILFTSYSELIKVFILYSVLGIILYFVEKYMNGYLKNFLFFTIFAVTVTSSVKLAGVLIVFSILVSPALIAITLKLKRPLLSAWLIGIIVNIIAIFSSFKFDFPTGYTVVMFHSSLSLLVYLAVAIKNPAHSNE